ncbi:ribonuclease HIII [Spiroplasma eriocheiris]|uniref:Ribonuclease n=1 Tax=Spiroplasma eriocheiris TaxID=315358 RepID=A0A0H3XHR8_9MOLU|nr:ribonuclease HIII [Spiroplasma eriocheiris]AHF57865.1 putative ribonuclease HIII [Spiroplasma eriocheiris CCTCC M 207170]AKM54308.1 ribonuclease HIII [Spiroplasma eriocheiris]
MTSCSFKKVNNKVIANIQAYYQPFQIANKDPNKVAVYFVNNITISIYHTKTVLFQGEHCEQEAKKFFQINNPQLTPPKTSLNYYEPNVIGNDEVGVGDVFGPLVVTSCFIDKNVIPQLKTLGIKDSKKLSDYQIMQIGGQLKKIIPYHSEIIDNQTYNDWYDQYQNSHVIKAIAHNNAIKHLIKKYHCHYRQIIIDQFVNEKKYYEYLAAQPEVINHNVIFVTKGEDKSLAVACSAIISRYLFLESIMKLEYQFQIALPLGASEQVKLLANAYKKQFKPTEYRQFMKIHFNLAKK